MKKHNIIDGSLTQTAQGAGEFALLVENGVLSRAELDAAAKAAKARGIELEMVLLREFSVSKARLLESLEAYYHCPSVEYDERLPIPPGLLIKVSADSLSTNRWMPIIQEDSGTVVVAARDPQSRAMQDDVRRQLGDGRYEFRIALDADIQWYIQDFLHARPGHLIGTERTGLAFWRNTMAQWRTRMACYRTDLAKARTGLAFLRWGLGTIALSNALLQSKSVVTRPELYFFLVGAGMVIALSGLPNYWNVRRSRMKPPGSQTITEVTAATIQFLENYHVLENTGVQRETRGTMLARMGDMLADYSTYLGPSPSSKTRTMYARERNVLAAQRTIAACYRTIYARARTGLAFIRTGMSLLGIGIGSLAYFGLGLLTSINLGLMAAGILMIVDGLLWYWPVRREQAEVPRGIAYPD